MAEEIEEPENLYFRKLMRDASRWCGEAYDAKRLKRRDETLEYLRRALDQIGLAFLDA